MRRLAIIPLLAVATLVGCSQVTQFAGDTLGIPVDEVCTTIDDVYAQYETLLEKGDASEEQLETARTEMVTKLDELADSVGGELGNIIRDNAERLADLPAPDSPEAIETVERIRDSASSLCG